MPIRKTVYDKGDAKADPVEKPRTIEMWGVDADEAVRNDPKRYSLGKPAGWGSKTPDKPVRSVPRPAPAVPDQVEPNE